MKKIKHPRRSLAISPMLAEPLESRRMLYVPPYTFFVGDAIAYEGTTADLSLTTVGLAPWESILVSYATQPGSASATDFQSTSGQVTLTGTASSATIQVPILADNSVELDEPFTIQVTSVGRGTIGRPPSGPDGAIVTVTIVDRPALVTLASLSGGSEDADAVAPTTPMRFEVSRGGGDTTQPLTVTYALAGTGANPADGADYAAVSGEVTIPANSATAVIEVAVEDDDEIEAAFEGAQLTLTGGGLGQSYVFEGFHALNNPNPAPPTSASTIQDNDFRIVAAKAWFDHQGLKGDDGYAYGDSWVDWDGDGNTSDANEQVKSISYFRSDATTDRFVKAMIYFEVEGNFTSPSYKIEGTGSGPGGGNFEHQVTLQTNGSTRYFYAEDTSNAKLPTTIDHGTLAIQWQIVREKRPDKPISYGSTSNTIYVTGAAAPGAFETVVKLGCEGADNITPGADEDANDNGVLDPSEDLDGNGRLDAGEDTDGDGILDPAEDANGNGVLDGDKAVTNGVWSRFSGNSTMRVSNSTTPMQYNHDKAVVDPSTGVTIDPGAGSTAAKMLADATGRGRCTAWADLLVQALAAQGVGATSVRMWPKIGYDYVQVKPSPAQGSGGSNYAGTIFNFHQVVQVGVYPQRIYDPSYGGDPAEDATDGKAAYEDLHVDRYWQEIRVWNPHTLAWEWVLGNDVPDIAGFKELVW